MSWGPLRSGCDPDDAWERREWNLDTVLEVPDVVVEVPMIQERIREVLGKQPGPSFTRPY